MNKTIKEKELLFAKVKSNAIIPTKRKEDAGRDVYTCETETIVISPCSVMNIDTGIAIGCNPKYFPKFFDKGGMGSQGIIVGSGVGDSGYRNSYFVTLANINHNKWLILSNQSDSEIKESTHFSLGTNQLVKLSSDRGLHRMINKNNCIIKPINKAIAQFVMIEVPEFEEKEVSWDELKSYTSKRGLGKLGSSGK